MVIMTMFCVQCSAEDVCVGGIKHKKGRRDGLVFPMG